MNSKMGLETTTVTLAGTERGVNFLAMIDSLIGKHDYLLS